jgi:hypothetical protein
MSWLLLPVGLAATAVAAAAGAASLRLRSTTSFLLSAYLLGWANVIVASYALSVGDRLTGGTLLATLVVLAIAAVAVWHLTGRPAPELTALRRVAGVLAADRVLAFLAAAVALAYAYTLAIAVGTTPNDGDPLVYELARAAFWRQQGGIGDIGAAYDPRLDISPPHAEIGQLATMLLSGGDRFVALGQYVAVFALALAVAGIARRIGLPPREALFGALLVPLLPLVLLQSWTGFTDVVFASFLVAAAYFALGPGRLELVPFGLAVGLALGTKFLGPLLLPLVGLLVLVAQPPRRWPGFLGAGLAGVSGGAVWYLFNAFRAGDTLGDVDESGFQELTLPSVAESVDRYLLELMDLSGAAGADRLVYALAGVGLVAAAVLVRGRRPAAASTWLRAGVVVAVVPFVVAASGSSLAWASHHAWAAAGDERLANRFSYWRPPTVADGAISGYGPVGVLMAVAAIPLAAIALRRRLVPRAALVLVLAPLAAILIVSLTIEYLRYQGRYFMAGIALGASLWGLAARWRPAAVGIATAAIVTAALCLVNSLGKPSGIALLEGTAQPSVWSLPRWQQQGLLRRTPSERDEVETIRYVEEHVPPDARIGIALEENSYAFPYFGQRLAREVSIVDEGDVVRPEVEWLVVAPSRSATACVGAWALARRGGQGWQVWRRVTPDACRRPAPLAGGRRS